MLGDLKYIRLKLGLTQFELAVQSGVSLPTIQNIEAGKANPSLDIIDKLMEALGLKLKIEFPEINIEIAAYLGVPLSRKSNLKMTASKDLLRREARKWALSFEYSNFSEREKLAFSSFLCALKDHWPSFYNEIKTPLFEEEIQKIRKNGHAIKLRRISISNLSKYL